MKLYKNITSFFQSHRSDMRFSNYGRIYNNNYPIASLRPKIRTLGRQQIQKERILSCKCSEKKTYNIFLCT